MQLNTERSIEEIVKRADGEILNNEDPHPHFYDLSLSQIMGDALSALNCFGKFENRAEISKLNFRSYYNHITAGMKWFCAYSAYHRAAP
jgi:hypothetical protein